MRNCICIAYRNKKANGPGIGREVLPAAWKGSLVANLPLLSAFNMSYNVKFSDDSNWRSSIDVGIKKKHNEGKGESEWVTVDNGASLPPFDEVQEIQCVP